MSNPSAEAQQTKALLEKNFAAYKLAQLELSKGIQARTQLTSQYNENESVIEELNRLDDDANVFKLIGPALIRQDLVEAKSNVSKRIEYIKNEMDRSDSQLKSLESKNKDKEAELIKLQKKLQSLAQGP
ncbi:Prefoldin [Dunaliella salina]|uniref:Prefoldin n=1 Tax=Dunaliella salina TaxID=3046 RepID=A0ABQ7GJC8_DUNSA|nr:Prefoldin [Dunaliella salina]|eukprot:KAF5834674.1 Prefoldin [Dunaliella salina]